MRKRVHLLLFSLLVMGLLTPTLSEARRLPSSESGELFERVRESMRKNNLPEAQGLLEKSEPRLVEGSGQVVGIVRQKADRQPVLPRLQRHRSK